MRKSVVPLVVLLFALCAPTASARVVEDAHCDNTPSATNILGHRRYSESFVTGRTGKLFQLYIESWGAGDFTLEVWKADANGLPTGDAPLAYAVATSQSAGFETLFAPLPKPIAVKKGTTLAFVAEVPDPANTGLAESPSNPCTGVFAYQDATGPGPYTIDPSSRDISFATWIRVRRRRR